MRLLKMDWKRKTKPKSCCRQCDYHHGPRRWWPMTQTAPRTLDMAAAATKMDKMPPLLHGVPCSQCRAQGGSIWLAESRSSVCALFARELGKQGFPASVMAGGLKFPPGCKGCGIFRLEEDPDPGSQYSSESTPGSKKLQGPEPFW